MKDPLRYYLAEGFMIIVCYPDPNDDSNMLGKYRCTDYVAHKVRPADIAGVRCLVVDDVVYPVNGAFFMHYAAAGSKSEEEAVAKIHAWAAATDVANAEFLGAMKLMEMV